MDNFKQTIYKNKIEFDHNMFNEKYLIRNTFLINDIDCDKVIKFLILNENHTSSKKEQIKYLFDYYIDKAGNVPALQYLPISIDAYFYYSKKEPNKSIKKSTQFVSEIERIKIVFTIDFDNFKPVFMSLEHIGCYLNNIKEFKAITDHFFQNTMYRISSICSTEIQKLNEEKDRSHNG